MHGEDLLLDVSGLRTSFRVRGGVVQAVRGVDFCVRQGEILGVVGESGSGKSVSMKALIGMLPDTASVQAERIAFAGRDLFSLSEKEMCAVRGNEISMIFQDPMTSLNPLKRVGDHIVEILERHRHMEAKEARKEAVRMLDLVGVPSPETRVRQYPHEFSGGMRQRVLIAMALACKPRLLIADEPTTALDVTIQAQILDLIRRLQQQGGMSVILITHDLGIVASLCHRIAVMYGGLIMEMGTTEDIFYRAAHPYTRALLRAIPSIDAREGERLVPIDGQAPSLLTPPPGCPFAPRCHLFRPACEQGIPAFQTIVDGHGARCPFTAGEGVQ